MTLSDSLGLDHKALLMHMPRSAQELPNEVVQEIFAEYATTTLSTATPTLFPWFLGHICSTWRYIFLSMTTKFWRKISIYLKGDERTVNVLRFFLQRDPAAPFSFHLVVTRSRPNPQTEDRMRRTMEALVDESMRWKSASIYLRTQDLLPLIRIKNRLPLLQELVLSVPQFSREGIPDAVRDVFQHTPSLNIVNILNLDNWRFNFSNLKAIDVLALGSGASNFVAALPQMTKLEELKLNDCLFDDAIPSSTIVLPNLITLNCKPGSLRFLKAPALQELFINCEGYDSSGIVLSFLYRSSCSLNISRLGISGAPAAIVTEIIRHTPRTVHLELAYTVDVGDAFEQLTVPANPVQEVLACHLQSLCICDTFSDDDMKLLYDLISSRTVRSMTDNCGHERLQRMEIRHCDLDLSLDSREDVIALCEERAVQYVEECPGD